ncbi:arsenate reductase ArsC [Magnetovibrio sp. PR-2]|uniref:arsenate reductase ArsC n=1 Tax=Magnetovibrio sp. PR-2 TaxID=3120356 RepID=UPI002FCE43F9
MTADKVFNVLFLCTGNSARSIMGESIINREGLGKFKGFSAASGAVGEVHPRALQLLSSMNYPTQILRSKNWDEFAAEDAPVMDFVFTVCDDAAKETCPVWPGQPMTAHWGIPDPVQATGTDSEIAQAFNDTYRMLNQRISIFTNLPLAAIDRLSLQKRLDDLAQES